MFEKRFGDRGGIEDVIVSKRKFQYEEVSSIKFVHTGSIFVILLISSRDLFIIYLHFSVLGDQVKSKQL